jgi:hypothetical protein
MKKIHDLERIYKYYDPGNMAAFDKAIARSLSVTGLWKAHIDEMSGKKN